MSTDKAICTIIAKNYLAYARVLADSFRQYNPAVDIYVLVIDKIEGYIDPSSEDFNIATIEDINDPQVLQLLFKYDVLESSTAVKPFFMDYLLTKYSLTKLIYFDPDILFTAGVDELWSLLNQHPVLLTPHILDPIVTIDRYAQMEMDVLRCGIYNLGFLAIYNCDDTRKFLEWWKVRLNCYCSKDIPPLFVDQKWINLLPTYMANVHIVRDPGYNVAWWNLFNRKVSVNRGLVTVNGSPLKFYHFSGFDLNNIDQISKNQGQYTLKDFPELKPLFYKYLDLILAHGHASVMGWPYHYDYFDNETHIADVIRHLYLSLYREHKTDKFKANPFLTAEGSFYEWLNTMIDSANSACRITNLWYEIYKSRPHLQEAYRNIAGDEKEAFCQWCATEGKKEFDLDDAFLTCFSGSQIPETKKPNFKFKSLFYNRVWLSAVSGVKKLLVKLGIRNERMLKSLSYFKQGIDILLFPGDD